MPVQENVPVCAVPRPEYPRPQFRRSDWINLNGEWGFAFDDDDVGVMRRWHNVEASTLWSDGSPYTHRITVPFCFQAPLSGIGDTSFHDVVWYARTFFPPAIDANAQRLLLHFGAVDYRATVWVNGRQVAEHEGGHTPFCADITHALDAGENVLVLRVEDPSEDATIPRGKQYWKEEPETIFYTRTTGIWQTVWLERVSRAHIGELRLTPDIDAWCIDVEVAIEGFEPGLRLRLEVGRGSERVVHDAVELEARCMRRRLRLPESTVQRLWSPEQPNLFDLRLELLAPNTLALDSVDSYFGMRKIETRGGEVRLNNRPYYQRLVLDHGYFPGGILTAPADGELRRDIELAKAMGFNGARKHQKVEDPRWLYWADRLGFLVWGEMANAFEYSLDYVRRITSEWQEVIRRDYNHPCVVVWVPINESSGARRHESDPLEEEHLMAMYHLTRSLDRTRLIVTNEGWEHVATDLCTIHDYSDARMMAHRYQSLETTLATYPTQRLIHHTGHSYHGEPILVTEFGGIAFKSDDPRAWGYLNVSDAEEYLRSYGDMVSALMRSSIVRGFCYTQLTDVAQEINGLLTYDRRPKVDLERIRGITTGTELPMRAAL